MLPPHPPTAHQNGIDHVPWRLAVTPHISHLHLLPGHLDNLQRFPLPLPFPHLHMEQIASTS